METESSEPKLKPVNEPRCMGSDSVIVASHRTVREVVKELAKVAYIVCTKCTNCKKKGFTFCPLGSPVSNYLDNAFCAGCENVNTTVLDNENP